MRQHAPDGIMLFLRHSCGGVLELVYQRLIARGEIVIAVLVTKKDDGPDWWGAPCYFLASRVPAGWRVTQAAKGAAITYVEGVKPRMHGTALRGDGYVSIG